ncbi:MFS transporter [Novosphingobium album (ex Hu et al. 2023)]|uniref:MFS transporter n=1 Tax=Novosphingobium album (ex Hu et al. 2023) TaxID=2930093 RepID=A0ABT0B173_9SPHN|nr:MFS transporter [Novosphingobium album (ex Hu et al. 2023)]MCJ2178821.1 MFS transporter [Novosphingobium album (ex Hu et al. 2023)]
MATTSLNRESVTAAATPIPASAYIALALLASANLLNYLDRFVVSILAEAIKADLRLDDAQLGFLLGTAFAIFYSIVGVAMGGISDRLSRKKVMAFGLALWSGMTALGGMATNFVTLAAARIGVGVGEAAANPCSHSLLSDIFPARNRALALGVYLAGTFLGGALAMAVGGYFLQHWSTSMCVAVPIAGACDLAAWKAALFAVGLPGFPLALLLLMIREPARTASGGSHSAGVIIREFSASLPPFTLLTVAREGGQRALRRNLAILAGIAVAAALLVMATGDYAQWIAFGTGAYVVVTWGQIQSLRDRPLFALTFGDRTFLYAMGATALIACVGGAINVWAAPFAMRTHAMNPSELGLRLGVIHTVGAIAGVIAGGWIADKWKQVDRRAPLGMAAISISGTLPSVLVMLLVADLELFLAAYAAVSVFGAMWSGATAALVQDLVLPRMRGSAAACYSLIAIVVASGTGPYWAGKVSAVTGSLTTGMLSLLVLAPVAMVFLWLAARRLPGETPEARLALAAAAGEPSVRDTA